MKSKYTQVCILIVITLLFGYSAYCWVNIIHINRTRHVSRDLYAVVNQVDQKPPTIARAEEFLHKLQAIDTKYAPTELQEALQEYITSVEQPLSAWKSGQDTTAYDQKIRERSQKLRAALKKYS
jgi:DNA repair ATPase RecN